MHLPKLLEMAEKAARLAGEEILRIYNSIHVQQLAEKKADHSPLTEADRRAHTIITHYLNPAGIPVVSEEGKETPYEQRSRWEYLWMIDPLDGTREFLSRNGEFTVNIALISRGEPVLGVVGVPVTGEVYGGGQDLGAWVSRGGTKIPLARRSSVNLKMPGIRVVASRSHLNDATRQFIETLQEPQLISKGSSLKFMLVAEGRADVYPRFGPTMEWDTAAAHAIVRTVGLRVADDTNGKELSYNKRNLQNPSFICF